jgi:hypothetical protein
MINDVGYLAKQAEAWDKESTETCVNLNVFLNKYAQERQYKDFLIARMRAV